MLCVYIFHYVHQKGYCVGYHYKLNLDNSTCGHLRFFFPQIFKEKNVEWTLNIIYFMSNNNNNNNNNKIFKKLKNSIECLLNILFPNMENNKVSNTHNILFS
jgi:hypothetical protein